MLTPTYVWDTYWTFAHKRHEMWWSRFTRSPYPWTDDPILQEHRFTNSYRVLDRVSQYLVAHVQYGQGRSQAVDELFFRTLLFKIFNKISTWELIERELGSVSWQAFNPDLVVQLLNQEMNKGNRLYSAAYIMPSPPFGYDRKHANHIAFLVHMMERGIPNQIAQSESLGDMYRILLKQPGVGKFLAFQYAIDLNYSSLTPHDESEFVIAGPGAHDGLSKCFSHTGGMSAEDIIMECYKRQRDEFERLNLPFRGLFGRPLQPIDIQNCYCETSKYTRKSHPDVIGVANRSKIKQKYKQDVKPLMPLFLPPKWNVTIPKSV